MKKSNQLIFFQNKKSNKNIFVKIKELSLINPGHFGIHKNSHKVYNRLQVSFRLKK